MSIGLFSYIKIQNQPDFSSIFFSGSGLRKKKRLSSKITRWRITKTMNAFSLPVICSPVQSSGVAVEHSFLRGKIFHIFSVGESWSCWLVVLLPDWAWLPLGHSCFKLLGQNFGKTSSQPDGLKLGTTRTVSSLVFNNSNTAGLPADMTLDSGQWTVDNINCNKCRLFTTNRTSG